MRGRETEWAAVLDLLRAAEEGRGGTLLIDGEPGTGKSRLLAEAADTASAWGFSMACGTADEMGQLAPLAPLYAALGESPALVSGGAGDGTDVLHPRAWLVERLRHRLEQRLARGPVLVVVDDLQWADPATLMALRTLHGQLASHPLVWMLARCTVGGHNDAARLFNLLEQDGSGRVEIGPLPDDQVAGLITDELGAAPDPALLRLAAGAGGNQALLVELLAGLRDEGALRFRDGRVGVTSPRLPRRVRRMVRQRLDALSHPTRQLLETAAVLGQSFSPDDVAELLATTPAALLPALDEALAAGILVPTAEALTFRHALVWQLVLVALPPSIRKALHRQIGEVLLGRGGSAVPAAAHLVQGARHGDARALRGLDQAVEEVLASSPQTAADLAVRSLELTDPADPDRFRRTVRAIDAATEAGRLDEAEQLARSALDQPVSALAHAQLRCALSGIRYLGGQAADAVTEAEAVLGTPGLPGTLTDRAELALLHALAGQHDNNRAAERAESILAASTRHGDAALVGATMVLSVIRWDAGRLEEGLRLAHDAVHRASGGSTEARRTHPRLALAAMLTDQRRLDEAQVVIRQARAEVEALGHVAWAAGPAVLGSRVELIAGRLDDAVTEAEVGLATADALGTHLFSSLAQSVLGEVALRRGDLRAAARHVESHEALLSHYAAPYAQARCAVVAGQVAEAREDAQRAMELVADVYAQLPAQRWALVGEPTTGAWLVRVALGVGDRARAEQVAVAAQGLARDNPGFPTVASAAAHVRGLLDADASALAFAAREGADGWARASAAEDLGVLLADRDRGRAIRSLEAALTGYAETGAVRDVARVRRRLRRMGVRHRHWAYANRPVAGWGSLTDTERAVALLVTQGWTNRQVAQQMFVSVHTVAFHVRQIFRKLDIGSRVELTRLAVEEGHRPERSRVAREA